MSVEEMTIFIARIIASTIEFIRIGICVATPLLAVAFFWMWVKAKGEVENWEKTSEVLELTRFVFLNYADSEVKNEKNYWRFVHEVAEELVEAEDKDIKNLDLPSILENVKF